MVSRGGRVEGELEEEDASYAAEGAAPANQLRPNLATSHEVHLPWPTTRTMKAEAQAQAQWLHHFNRPRCDASSFKLLLPG